MGPDYTVANAKVFSSAWSDTGVHASIRFNQMTCDFTSVGGPANVIANLTLSGNVQWLQAENMWERQLLI